MQKIKRMFESYRETILLPLVICVVMPGAAGVWWRHVHEEPRPQAAPLSAILEAAEMQPEACPVTSARPRKSEGTTRRLVASTVPPGDR